MTPSPFDQYEVVRTSEHVCLVHREGDSHPYQVWTPGGTNPQTGTLLESFARFECAVDSAYCHHQKMQTEAIKATFRFPVVQAGAIPSTRGLYPARSSSISNGYLALVEPYKPGRPQTDIAIMAEFDQYVGTIEEHVAHYRQRLTDAWTAAFAGDNAENLRSMQAAVASAGINQFTRIEPLSHGPGTSNKSIPVPPDAEPYRLVVMHVPVNVPGVQVGPGANA